MNIFACHAQLNLLSLLVAICNGDRFFVTVAICNGNRLEGWWMFLHMVASSAGYHCLSTNPLSHCIYWNVCQSKSTLYDGKWFSQLQIRTLCQLPLSTTQSDFPAIVLCTTCVPCCDPSDTFQSYVGPHADRHRWRGSFLVSFCVSIKCCQEGCGEGSDS